MKNTQKMYTISGYTKANKWCCSFMGSDLKKVIANFISRYPRFKGEAQIRHSMHKDCGHGLWMKNSPPWETMDTFQSTKELKTYGV